jgi:hypothetical protein
VGSSVRMPWRIWSSLTLPKSSTRTGGSGSVFRVWFGVCGREPVLGESVGSDAHGRGGRHGGALGCPVGEARLGVAAGRERG